MQRSKSPPRIMSPAKAKAKAKAKARAAIRTAIRARAASPPRSLWPSDRRPASPSSPSYAPAGWGRRSIASPGEYDGLPFADAHRAADAALDEHRAFVENEYAELEAATKADTKFRRFRESLAAAQAASAFVPPVPHPLVPYEPPVFVPVLPVRPPGPPGRTRQISTKSKQTKLAEPTLTMSLLKRMYKESNTTENFDF